MATPTDFTGTNVTMTAPPGRSDVQDVRAFKNRACCVTAWQLTEEEMEEVARTGRIYLSVFMGGGMPPVFVGGEDAVRPMIAEYGGAFPKQGI